MNVESWTKPRVNTKVCRNLLDLFLEVDPLLQQSLLGVVSIPFLDLELPLYLLDLIGELRFVGDEVIDLLEKTLTFLVLATICEIVVVIFVRFRLVRLPGLVVTRSGEFGQNLPFECFELSDLLPLSLILFLQPF